MPGNRLCYPSSQAASHEQTAVINRVRGVNHLSKTVLSVSPSCESYICDEPADLWSNTVALYIRSKGPTSPSLELQHHTATGQTYATSGKMPDGLVAEAVLVAGATVAGTLSAAIYTVDISLWGNTRVHDGEVSKKLDNFTAEVKELKKGLENFMGAAKLGASACA